MQRLVKSERGNTIVEFALASTVFFMTVFGIFGFGLAVWNYNMVSDLAQEGARWASVRGSSGGSASATDVQTFVSSRAQGLTVTATTTWPGGSNNAGNTVQVIVTNSVAPIPFITTATMTLTSTARMIIAR